jgi:hypothetical protein
MDASNTVTEFTLCQLPDKAYEKDLVTTIVSSLPASLSLDRFGKIKPESGAFLDIVLKETVFFAEGGTITPIILPNIFVTSCFGECNQPFEQSPSNQPPSNQPFTHPVLICENWAAFVLPLSATPPPAPLPA